MQKSLHKFTTQYVDLEDRILIAGATPDGETLSLWLTHRLLAQLVPALCHCIERHSSAGQLSADLPATVARPAHQQQVIQEFEQQAANSNLKPAERVTVTQTSPVLLIDEATVELHSAGVNVQLGCTPQNQTVYLAFQPETLRQWMGILFNAYCNSRWTKEFWPNWLKAPTSNTGPAELADGSQVKTSGVYH